MLLVLRVCAACQSLQLSVVHRTAVLSLKSVLLQEEVCWLKTELCWLRSLERNQVT